MTRLWLPTSKRIWEARLGPIGQVKSWVADRDEYDQDRADELAWIYLLSGDENSRLWARLFRLRYVAAEPAWFRDVIKGRIRSSGEDETWYALIDRRNGEVH